MTVALFATTSDQKVRGENLCDSEKVAPALSEVMAPSIEPAEW